MGPRPGQLQEVAVAAEREPGERQDAFLAGAAYGVLFLLGAVQAGMGSFQYGWAIGSVPAAALGCCAAIFLTCLLAGWLMRSLGGALLPAIAWILVSFVLAMPDAQGSVVITNTAGGKWYLYGGAVSALLGVAAAFAIWVRGQSGAKPGRDQPGQKPSR